MLRAVVIGVLASASLSCNGRDRSSAANAPYVESAGGTAVTDPDPAGLVRSRTGIVFDPAAVAVGDSIGALVLATIDARPTAIDSTWVGTALFDGMIQLDGRTIAHHGHPDVQATCFEADSASADRLPRWKGDRRRPWFCLANAADATAHLAAPGVVRDVTIVIDSFTIHRGRSDETNSARLVRVVVDSAK